MIQYTKVTPRLMALFSVLVMALLAACGQPALTALESDNTTQPVATVTLTRVVSTPMPTSTATPNIPTPTATMGPAIYFNRGVDYRKAEDLESALEAFNQAIALDPEYSEAFYERGRTHAIQGNLDLAIADWSRAIELDPSYMEAYYFRAFAYDDTGEFAKAIEDYSKVIEFDPQLAEAYYWQGRGYVILAELEDGIADLKKALELNLAAEYAGEAQAFLDELIPLAAGEIDFGGYWSGNTDQGEVITFEIEGDEIVAYSVGFQIPGCEDLTPFHAFGGAPKGMIQGNQFSIEDHFTGITGAFNSSGTAVGTIEISCEEGLTTTWAVFKGVQAVRTPSPDDLAKFPQLAIRDDLYSRADGAANFDEYAGIVADNGDWFLLRSYAESVLPIPSGWKAISNPFGAHYVFDRDGIEENVVQVNVGRDCTEAETSETLIVSMEEYVNTDPALELLKEVIVDDKKGYLLLEMDAGNGTTRDWIDLFSKPREGCFHYLNLSAAEKDWADFYPIFWEISAHWYDLSNHFLGFDLPPAVEDLSN